MPASAMQACLHTSAHHVAETIAELWFQHALQRPLLIALLAALDMLALLAYIVTFSMRSLVLIQDCGLWAQAQMSTTPSLRRL